MRALARHLAGFLGHRLVLPPERVEVLAFGAVTLLNSLLTTILIVAVAALTGNLLETSLAAGIAVLFRLVLGGFHCSTPLGCTVFSVAVFTLLGASSRSLAPLAAVLPGWAAGSAALVLCLIIAVVIRRAPVETPAHPLSETRRTALKTRGLVLHLLWLALILPGLLLRRAEWHWWLVPLIFGYLWQAFTLTPAAHCLMKVTDHACTRIRKGV